MQAVQTARDGHIMLLLENRLRYFAFCLNALAPGVSVDGVTLPFACGAIRSYGLLCSVLG
jgi:hypothetical protein